MGRGPPYQVGRSERPPEGDTPLKGSRGRGGSVCASLSDGRETRVGPRQKKVNWAWEPMHQIPGMMFVECVLRERP